MRNDPEKDGRQMKGLSISEEKHEMGVHFGHQPDWEHTLKLRTGMTLKVVQV